MEFWNPIGSKSQANFTSTVPGIVGTSRSHQQMEKCFSNLTPSLNGDRHRQSFCTHGWYLSCLQDIVYRLILQAACAPDKYALYCNSGCSC